MFTIWPWLFMAGTSGSGAARVTRALHCRFGLLVSMLFAIGLIMLATVISGYILTVTTEARLPYIDSFTTWASILTTVMVARKVLENWLYWIVINSVSIFLYLDRELYQTAAMFVLYLVLATIGYFAWRKNYLEQNAKITAANPVCLAAVVD